MKPEKKNRKKTGLTDNLKSGIENLSGHSMDDVKVHTNSAKPSQLQAHAFAQGTDIHLAAGQEKHLPHEAWNIVQQKQGRVNLTIQDIPFNEKFCTHLKYHLGSTFENSDRQDFNGFWCDGISWDPIPDKQLTKKSVNDTRQIVTKAWIGKDGQDEYEMTIRFGQYALRRYAKGTEMIDCIPSSDSMNWIDIEPENKRIEIRLK
ncbi:MAG: DUF4157 domain-containing protein [Aequorivita antarctica]